MQYANVIVMPDRSANPESVPALRKEVKELAHDIEVIQESITAAKEPTRWQVWNSEHPIWSKVVPGLIVALIVAVVSGIGLLIHTSTNSYIDGRVRGLIKPLGEQVGKIDERTSRMDGELIVLTARLAATKYSNAPNKDLKEHRDELTAIKKNLATARTDTPDFWPTSFQIITLVSKTNFDVNPSDKPILTLDGATGVFWRAFALPPGAHILLKHVINDSVFHDVVVTLDSSVELRNVTFVNCVLILPAQENPPKPIQNIGSALLAADLAKVTIKES
jgi:hypothetical protein